MPFLRQSTIQSIRFGPFLDATDGVTEEEALTITQALRRISKDGAAYAASSETGNSTHDSDGWYFDDFTVADTDTVGELLLNVQDPATFLPFWKSWWVLPQVIFDALFGDGAAGFDANGRVSVGSFLASAVVLSGGLPDVNVASIDDIAAPALWVGSFNNPSAAAISTAVWSETVRILTANTNFNDPTAAAISATVWAETVRILTASTNFNDISTAQVRTQVDDGLVAIHLDHLFAVNYDPSAIPGVAGALWNEILEDDGEGLARYTAKALENVPLSGGGFITAAYRWDTDTGATDPGSGDVKADNGSFVAITEIYISSTTNTGFNADEILGKLAVNDKILLSRESGGGGNFVQATVSGATTDNGGWWTIPVSIDDSAGSFLANSTINVTLGFQAATAEAIADAVWDEDVVSAHGSADSAGLIISELTKRSVTFSTAVVSGSIFDQIADDGTEVFDRTTDSLQAIADSGGGGPTAADIADAVWDENKADHDASGSTGEALGGTLMLQTTILSHISQTLFTLNGGSLDDDAYNNCLIVIIDQTSGFQKTYGTILNYVGSSRGVTLKADPGIFTTAVNDLVLIYAPVGGFVTDAITADAMDIDFGREIADRILARNIGAGSDGGRTIQDAFRAIRNRRAIVAGTLSVFEEDDSTVAWTAAVTTTFGNPISEIDPA